MSFEEILQDMQLRKKAALAMGGQVKLEKRRETGVLNARERISYLVDEGSFLESGLYAASVVPEMREKTPADGKICGTAKVDRRPIAVVSNDFTVVGASSSLINMKKIKHMKKIAKERGLPLVFLGESSGARIPDRMGASGRATLGQDPQEYLRSRETPWVSALLGDCYGSSTWYTCMSDFAVMRKGATMAVASGRVTSMAINQEVDPEELGGWRLHTETTGLVDLAVNKDEEAIDSIKKFLSYLPSHCNESTPTFNDVGPGAEQNKIFGIFSLNRQKVYDVRDLIRVIFDAGTLFELKPRFGKSLVTGFARLKGKTVGLIANNPKFKGGAIDVDACRKATSFLVLCDSFNVPLVFLVDQPGFLIGPSGERQAAPGHIINWMNALQLCTVPKISVILRKSYGQAYLNMGGGQNSDEVLCWPTADLGFMDPEISVNVLYGLRREDDPARFEQLIAEVTKDTSAWELAALYETQLVIDPRETREVLAELLHVHSLRLTGGVGAHLLNAWPTSL